MKILNGDCLELLDCIESESVDLILCDPPYGVTSHKWDVPISMWFLFNKFRRIIKPKGSILIFGIEPFSSKTRLLGEDMYKYDWIWNKTRKHGYHHSNSMPIQETENISVFSHAFVQSTSKNNIIFNPAKHTIRKRHSINCNWKYEERFDTNILKFANVPLCELFHPSQKPIDLLEYLILRHTNEGDVVLDPCFGSGSTLVASRNTGRDYIGFEKEKEFVDIAHNRLSVDVLTRRRWKKKSICIYQNQ